MSVKANGRYMTWWNAKRINSKVKYSELAELLGLKRSQIGQLSGYFIGKVMPKEDMIRKIADAFGVPYDEAYSHFFNDWCGSKSKNQVKTFSAQDDILKSPDKDPEIKFDIFVGNTLTEDKKTDMLDRESINYILDAIYGKVSRDVYETVSRMFIKEIKQ